MIFSDIDFRDINDLIPLVPYGYRGIEDKIISETIDKVSKQEGINMDTNFMKNMFGPIKGGLCRLSMDGTIAVKTANGYKSYNAAK